MEELPDFTTEEERAQLGRLEAQLDWHYRAGAGLDRLKTRLRQEGKPYARVLPFVRRFAAVAALLLVTLGLTSRLTSPGDQRQGTIPGVFASLMPARDSRVLEHAIAKPAAPNRAAPEARAALTVPPVPDRLLALRGGQLPAGPRVDLLLEVHNGSGKPIALDAGGPRTMLRLDLRGPATKSLFGKADAPPFLERRLVRLEPGESYFLPIPYLVGGQRGQLQGVYWTRPGRYTLSVLYRVGLAEERKDLYVSSPPIVLDVPER